MSRKSYSICICCRWWLWQQAAFKDSQLSSMQVIPTNAKHLWKVFGSVALNFCSSADFTVWCFTGVKMKGSQHINLYCKKQKEIQSPLSLHSDVCDCTTTTIQIYPFAGFVWLFYLYLCNRCIFCFKFQLLTVLWAQPCYFTLPMKSRKRLARNVIDTCVTHSDLVHDVRDTDYQTENGSTHSHIFLAFKHWF